MDDDFAKRVRSAAIAGWWTLLVAAIFLTVQWFAYLGIMAYKPAWAQSMWGGQGIEWTTIQNVWLWVTGIFKMCIWLAAMVVIWLTLWARRLRRA